MSQPNERDRPAAARATVAIIGGTGYGGAELCRLLLRHPRAALVRVTSIDHVGEPIESVHRNLPRTGLTFEDVPPERAAEGVDVVFLALPHRVSAKLAPALAKLDARVVDLSGDFRLRDAAAYARYYGEPHPHPEHLGSFVYGLPELHRVEIQKARRVASPGCFATTIALGLLPLAAQFSLTGKAGIARTKADGRITIGAVAVNASDKETEVVVGAGVRWDLTRNWGLRAEWERLSDSKLDIFSVGVQYKF